MVPVVSALACGFVAALIAAQVVPRVHVTVAADDPDPGLERVGSVGGVTAAALCAALGSFVAWEQPAELRYFWFVFSIGGSVLSVTDVFTTYLPKRLVHALALGLLGCSVWAGLFQPMLVIAPLIGGICMAGFFWIAHLLGAMAFGDVRFAFPAGMAAGVLGITGWWQSLVLVSLLGAVAALLWRLRGRSCSPYGPALWLGPLIIAVVL